MKMDNLWIIMLMISPLILVHIMYIKAFLEYWLECRRKGKKMLD